MSSDMLNCVAATVKALLHTSRDTLRNQGKKTRDIAFSMNNGYMGEAFGIMRCLEIQRFGYFGPNNLDGIEDCGAKQPEQNLRWWFSKLENEVLIEEGFQGDGHCAYCLEKYHKDDAKYYAAREANPERYED